MLKLYFGHPVNTYDTELERLLLQKISERFTWEIENPNQKHHQTAYKGWKEATGNGMDYFFDQVLPTCHGGIFLPFRDGKWGAGVYGEAQFLAHDSLPIWQITFDGIISSIDIDAAKILALSIEETRTRIRTASGETVPY